MKVPFFRSPWQSQAATAAQRLEGILADGAYILGRELAAFESELSGWIEGRPVVGVGSGTDALVLAMRSLDIGPGDEVILPAYTFYACFEAVIRIGATPVLIDSAEGDFLPGDGDVEAAITPRTRAVLAVPLFGDTSGLPAAQRICQRRGLALIEDVAQAFGGTAAVATGETKPAGAFGEASAFSFYPTKNLGAAGDAGAVCFRNAAHRERCLTLRNHGHLDGRHMDVGLNSRLDELQAALLRSRLANLTADLARRRAIAQTYIEAWKDLPGLLLPANPPGHAWNYFVARHPERDRLRRKLGEAGVDTRIYYARPIHHEPAYLDRRPEVALPNCEKLARLSFALPLYPDLTDGQVAWVIEAVKRECTCLD